MVLGSGNKNIQMGGHVFTEWGYTNQFNYFNNIQSGWGVLVTILLINDEYDSGLVTIYDFHKTTTWS